MLHDVSLWCQNHVSVKKLFKWAYAVIDMWVWFQFVFGLVDSWLSKHMVTSAMRTLHLRITKVTIAFEIVICYDRWSQHRWVSPEKYAIRGVKWWSRNKGGPPPYRQVCLYHMLLLSCIVVARGQVDESLNSKSAGLGFDSKCWPCVEVSGKLCIPHCCGPPSCNGYLVHRSKVGSIVAGCIGPHLAMGKVECWTCIVMESGLEQLPLPLPSLLTFYVQRSKYKCQNPSKSIKFLCQQTKEKHTKSMTIVLGHRCGQFHDTPPYFTTRFSHDCGYD